MRRTLALLLCAAVAAPACALPRASATRIAPPPTPLSQPGNRVDPMLMADYIRQLPVGSRVRISRADGSVLRATLMRRDTDPIVVQRRTRIPEAPVELAVGDILAVELETGNGHTGRNVAIGAATAVGATMGVLLLLAAIFSD